MQPPIVIRQLTKVYGDKLVLRGVDLEVQPGQVLGYIGPQRRRQDDHGEDPDGHARRLRRRGSGPVVSTCGRIRSR